MDTLRSILGGIVVAILAPFMLFGLLIYLLYLALEWAVVGRARDKQRQDVNSTIRVERQSRIDAMHEEMLNLAYHLADSGKYLSGIDVENALKKRGYPKNLSLHWDGTRGLLDKRCHDARVRMAKAE